MSVATKQATVRFSPKAGTYTTIIQSPSGDLYQEFEGSVGAIGAISPDFSQTQPQLVFIATSSRVAEGVSVPIACDWYFNDVKLTFTNNVSTNVFNGETGHFRKLPYVAGTQDYWGLKILKNLVVAAGAAPCSIKAEATVVYGNVTDKVEAVYNIPIRRATGSPYFVTIAAGDNKYYTITEKGGSCILKAMTYQAGVAVTSSLTYKWYKLVGTAWSLISGQTAQALTVTGDMVDSYSNFKCVVSQGGTEIGTDIQGVMDASDPYEIIPNPTPADETITEESDTVVYAPMVVKRGSAAKAMEMNFNFTAIDSVGLVLGQATNQADFTVTYAMCEQAGTDVGVYIETVS